MPKNFLQSDTRKAIRAYLQRIPQANEYLQSQWTHDAVQQSETSAKLGSHEQKKQNDMSLKFYDMLSLVAPDEARADLSAPSSELK